MNYLMNYEIYLMIEYFDKSWETELENYILQKYPEFKLNKEDE